MSEWNWQATAASAGVSLLSGAGGWLLGIWRWGRNSAKNEQAVKDDYDGKINALRDQMRTAMAEFAKESDERNDALVKQFKEAFDGIRRQIDDHKLDSEKRFTLKDDFREFREEYREDMRDLKASIAVIAQRQ